MTLARRASKSGAALLSSSSLQNREHGTALRLGERDRRKLGAHDGLDPHRGCNRVRTAVGEQSDGQVGRDLR